MKRFTILFVLLITLLSSSAYAAIPRLINYQGRLTDSAGSPLNGAYNLNFKIYDALTAGNILWEETQNGVVIQQGVFSVQLGVVTALGIAFDKPYFLEIKVGSEVMSPRQQMTAAGYALTAETLSVASSQQGDILYHNGSVWTRLPAGTNGNFLQTQGPNANPQWVSTIKKQLFTFSDTFIAPAGITTVYVTMVGGGGGGGYGGSTWQNAGGGGAGQSIIKCPITVVPATGYRVTVGNGGAGGGFGGGIPNMGTAGGSSIFAGVTTITAVGGNGGSLSITYGGKPGTGGTGGGGLDAVTTTPGIPGIKGGNGANGGAGGASMFGSGGTVANAGSGYGSGGGGGLVNGGTGGAGAGGFVLVEW